MTDDNLSDLWQSQTTEPPRLDPAEVRKRAARMVKVVRRRNGIEILAALLVAVAMGPAIVGAGTHWAVRVGAALVVAGVGFVSVRIATRASAEAPPADAPTSALIAHHRETLTRQRDLLRDVPRWYLAPLVPGLVWFSVAHHVATSTPGWMLAARLLFSALVFVAVAAINARAARKLTAEIDALGTGA